MEQSSQGQESEKMLEKVQRTLVIVSIFLGMFQILCNEYILLSDKNIKKKGLVKEKCVS